MRSSKQRSHAVEDYAKEIYGLQRRAGGKPVSTNALAERCGVTAKSALAIVKTLAERDLAIHEPHHGVRLTPAGERLALEMLRHHSLLERYLAEHLDVPWDRVHEEAEALEHVLPEDLEARIAAKLGHPTQVLHPDPIADDEGARPEDPREPDPAQRFLVELERLLGKHAPTAGSLERAARVVAAEESWRDGLGVLLDDESVASLLGVDRDRVAGLVVEGEMIVLAGSDGAPVFPAFQFQDGRPTPALTRAHRTLVELGHLSPWSAASWARTSHPELEMRSPAQWSGEHRDEERLLLVASRDAARSAQ